MFFRPSFCANCGEKIERAEWGLWTSRRFCPVCESQYKGHDLVPRAIVGFGLLIGVFGFGSYLKSGGGVRADLRSRQSVAGPASSRLVAAPEKGSTNVVQSSIQPKPDLKTGSEQNPPVEQKRGPVVKTVSAEPAYLCGAETKKGTPCSRRVKGNTRCFQHPGMPAMLAADKLRIADTP